MEEQDYRPEEEQEKKPKEKKYVTRREFRICFVILLLFVFFQSLSIKENIRQVQNNVSNVVYSAEKYSLQGTTQGRYLAGGFPPVRFSM